MKIYVIKGNPVALARARFGNNKKVYDPQKNLKLISSIDLSCQHGDLPLFTKALHLDVTFFMPIPTCAKKRGQRLGELHIFTPDLSNLIKYIEDISTGVLYTDDRLIASISSKKVYDNNPRTEFTIREL